MITERNRKFSRYRKILKEDFSNIDDIFKDKYNYIFNATNVMNMAQEFQVGDIFNEFGHFEHCISTSLTR